LLRFPATRPRRRVPCCDFSHSGGGVYIAVSMMALFFFASRLRRRSRSTAFHLLHERHGEVSRRRVRKAYKPGPFVGPNGATTPPAREVQDGQGKGKAEVQRSNRRTRAGESETGSTRSFAGPFHANPADIAFALAQTRGAGKYARTGSVDGVLRAPRPMRTAHPRWQHLAPLTTNYRARACLRACRRASRLDRGNDHLSGCTGP
jgi:hypothetical protein